MNLTAITDPKQILVKHFCDSLSLLRVIPTEHHSIIDVGTGAGFPGLPLAIAEPLFSVTLLDSLKKRLDFLDYVINELGLTNARTVHIRAEDAGKSTEHREAYDYALARAVAPLNILTELCLPLVKSGGYFLAMKGQSVQQEIAEAEELICRLGGKVIELTPVKLFDDTAEINHTVIQIRKITKTPGEYPRRFKRIGKLT
jgi:16S rRNA (guanine527-N7)-methyltransferase